MSETRFTTRNRLAALERHRGSDDPATLAARRDHKAHELEAYIRQVVDAAPPLLPEQRDRIALLLRGGAANDAA